jgi:hypothetical protein
MQVEIKKQVTTKIDVQIPCYFKTYLGKFYHITQSGVLITVQPFSQITAWHPKDSLFFGDNVEEMLRSGTKCDPVEFENAYADTINALGALVQLQA